jgi:hypothetical protein
MYKSAPALLQMTPHNHNMHNTLGDVLRAQGDLPYLDGGGEGSAPARCPAVYNPAALQAGMYGARVTRGCGCGDFGEALKRSLAVHDPSGGNTLVWVHCEPVRIE